MTKISKHKKGLYGYLNPLCMVFIAIIALGALFTLPVYAKSSKDAVKVENVNVKAKNIEKQKVVMEVKELPVPVKLNTQKAEPEKQIKQEKIEYVKNLKETPPQENTYQATRDCVAPNQDVILTSGGGLYPSEVSWSIGGCTDGDGNPVDCASGGASSVDTESTQEFCLDLNECYTVNMNDSYGDGWNGNVLTINGVEFTLYAGSSGTAAFGNCVFDCSLEEVAVTVNNGEGTDFGFAIFDSSGSVISGGNDFDGIGCFDLAAGCYEVSLASSGGTYGGGASLTVGDQTFTWANGTNGSYSSNFLGQLGACVGYGCTDATACNYDEDATTENGTCEYTSCAGCTDATACNYNENATLDDNSCLFNDCNGDCGGSAVEDCSGVCGGTSVVCAYDATGAVSEQGCAEIDVCLGCVYDWTDSGYANCDVAEDNGYSCLVLETDYSWDCTGCACDGFVYGCTSPTASNYNAEADVDDGSCEYDCPGQEVTLTSGGGAYSGEVSWSIGGCTDGDGNSVNCISGGATTEASDSTQQACLDLDECYTVNMNDSYGDGWNGNVLTINGEEFTLQAGSVGDASFGNCVFDCSLEEVAVTVNNGVDSDGEATDFGFAIFDSSGTVISGGNDFDGVGCFDLAAVCYDVSLSSAGGTSGGDATLTVGDQTFTWANGANGVYYSNFLGQLGTCLGFGCTDATACNYDDSAGYDDGSCWYREDCDLELCFTEYFDYEDGTSISETDYFSTWTGTEEAYVNNGQLEIVNGADVVVITPVVGSGMVEISFDMTIEDGATGYFNFSQSGNTADWQWAGEVYFNADGTAYVTADSDSPWTYTQGETMAVSTSIDLDSDEAMLKINNVEVVTWAWTGTFGGMDFFDNGEGNFTIDNLSICDGSPCDGSPGDVNNDAEVNVVDIVQMVSFILQNATPDDCEFGAADFNGNGEITVTDIVLLVGSILAE